MAANTIKFPPDGAFDDDYLARLRNGDPATAGHFNKYFRRLLGIMLSGAFGHQQTQDLIDEIMFAVITNIMRGQPRDAGKLVSYVRGVCSNLKNRVIRDRINNLEDADIDPDHLSVRSESAAERLVRKENARTIAAVLSELSERDRNVLMDLCSNQLTRDEVCAKYPPLTRDQLKVVLCRARQRFQKVWRNKE
jgi:RNA polymerase sigma factor (sigma-70 family)